MEPGALGKVWLMGGETKKGQLGGWQAGDSCAQEG